MPTTPNQPVEIHGPYIRWGAVVWGIVLAVVAIVGLWALISPDAPQSFTSWVMSLTPISVALYSVLVLAALALVGAIVVVIRNAQKRLLARSART